MRLSLRIVLAPTRQIVDDAVYFDCYATFARGEVHGVAPDFVLPHEMKTFRAHAAQNFPGDVFAEAHAAAGIGCFSARCTSQAPIRIIGSESSMPMVM